MCWLLQLFPAYRDLQDEAAQLRKAYDDASQENLRLLDRIEALSADRTRLWETMQTALDSERQSLRTQINHLVQRSGGGVPYPEAHTLPPHAVPREQDTSPIARPMMPGEAVRAQTSKFVKNYLNKVAEGVRVE